ncbi:MAG: hypothetical protein ABIS05_16165 [Roseateles sp.]
MKRLLLAECRLVGIPLRATSVPLQITISDGGEDGRVEWTGGVKSTSYLPSRFSAFQAKAQNLTAQIVKDEISKTDKKTGKRTLNNAMREVIRHKGAYIIFCSYAFTEQKIDALREALLTSVRDCNCSLPRLCAVEIYDANRIADWINQHSSAAAWMAEIQRGRSVAGFLSQDGWALAQEIYAVPWVDDASPRYVLEGIDSPDAGTGRTAGDFWNFSQLSEFALKFLGGEKTALRIAGPSGYGKTRFSYELFNHRTQIADAIDSAALLYADLAVVGEEIMKLALEIADSGSPTILIADECSDDAHGRLASIARRANSKLRIVSIDVETSVAPADDTLVLRLAPASGTAISQIARSVYPNLTDTDARLVEQLARGFPRMAILAAQQGGVGRKAVRSAEQLIDRIVWGRRSIDAESLRALESLSLFEWVGIKGQAVAEAALIAENFARMSHDAFIERILSFSGRGVLVQRGDYIQVSPVPLAAALATRRLALLVDQRLVSFFDLATERLQRSLLGRLKWLDNTAQAKEFARTMLHTDRMGNIAALQSDFGGACLDKFVHVDPDLTMSTIQRVFGGLDKDGLKKLGSGRRSLVWALEKLSFRRESFDSAATLLRRLAAAETERRISNNATGQFQQLFQLHLSGTEALPDARLLVLDEGLESTDPEEQSVCLGALDRMLKTHHFTRVGGAEEIGSAERLEDWTPQTLDEIWNFHRAAISRLTSLAISSDPMNVRAMTILASHVRGLLSNFPFTELKLTISQVIGAHGTWPEVIQEVNEWLYFDRDEVPASLGLEIREYFDELLPSDPIELAALYASGWETDFHDPDHPYDAQDSNLDFEYSTRQLQTLAEKITTTEPLPTRQIVERFASSHTNNLFAFAQRLAERAADPIYIFAQALAFVKENQTEANMQLFGGIFSGCDRRDPRLARECLGLALKSDQLKRNVIAIIGAGELQAADIAMVASLIRAGDIEPGRCAPLSYGRGMDHLPSDAIAPLLEALVSRGREGLWSVLDIMVMLLHGDKVARPELARILRSAMLAPDLFDEPVQTMDGHNLEMLISALVRRGLVDAPFCKALVKQLLSICAKKHQNAFHSLDGSVQNGLLSLAKIHPNEVWAGVAKLMLSKDWYVQSRLCRLIAPPLSDHIKPGILFAIPANIYLEWVREEPEIRARLIAPWLPICTQKPSDGPLDWHPDTKAFVEEFFSADGVLGEIAARLHPRSWWGSVSFHLQPMIELLARWRTHPQAEIRRFATSQIERFTSEGQEADRREEEDEVRLT